MSEIWKPVPGYEGSYEASTLGRIRSADRVAAGHHRVPGQILRLNPTQNGYYLRVALSQNGARRTFTVHRLVALTFMGPRPDGMEIRHLNGDGRDCRLDNLAYGTRSENILDQVAHGTHPNAAKTSCINGHPFTPENTYRTGRGHRACRKCKLVQRRPRAAIEMAR